MLQMYCKLLLVLLLLLHEFCSSECITRITLLVTLLHPTHLSNI